MRLTAILPLLLLLSTNEIYSQTKLLDAIEKKDSSLVKSLIADGARVNQRKLEIKSYLFAKRPKKNFRQRKYKRPIILVKRHHSALDKASWYNISSIMKLLIDNGANVNKAHSVLTPLCWAAHNGNFEMVKYLLDHNAKINGHAKSWKTSALIEAIEWKHTEIAEYLINNGADIHIKDREGRTALSHAASKRNFDLIKLLVGKGANVNHSDNHDKSILYSSIDNGIFYTLIDPEIPEYLLAHGAVADNNALGQACFRGEFKLLKKLLEKRPAVENNLIFPAVSGGNLELVKYLIKERNLDVKFRGSGDWDSTSTLVLATTGYPIRQDPYRQVNIELVKFLINEGVDINDPDKDNVTPLLGLAYSQKNDSMTKEATKMLVEKGAYINVFGGSPSYTPLMHAAASRQFETVKYLIEAGADVNAKTSDGITALRLACWSTSEEIIKHLVKNGADMNIRSSTDGRTPAMDAIIFGRYENIRTLIELGADPNIKSASGSTLLDMIADENLKKYLISKGAKSGLDSK